MALILKSSPESHLEELCKHLESIPDEFAKQSLRLIRDALASDGKLSLGRRRGRRSALERKFGRAADVASRVILKGVPRDDAIRDVAIDNGLQFDTVKKDYGRYGRYARPAAKFFAQVPRVRRVVDELETLLGTFTIYDGSKLLTDEKAKEIAGSVPIPGLLDLVEAIRNGPLRRDAEFLDELLSPIRDCGYEIPPI